MTNMELLFNQVKSLTSQEKQALIKFLQSDDTVTSNKIPKTRVLGLHAHLGKAWMSEDFDDELPDSFWLGDQ